MISIEAHNVIDYLRQTGGLTADEAAGSSAELLTGGVSNVVLRVTRPNGSDIVIKQSRAQLRTQAEWFSQPERIWRERDVLDLLSRVTPPGVVPKLLFADRDNFLFAMEAISREHLVWKPVLLDGTTDPQIARRLGEILGTIHVRTMNDQSLRDQLGDRTVYDELRLDPFYRYVAERQPDLRPALTQLIDDTLATPICLVLGDFSPKNILLIPGESGSDGQSPRLVLVDFETGHFGDPAFDLGFFLSHLLLKTIKHRTRADEFLEMVRSFWSAYLRTGVPLNESRAVAHLVACMLARVDGKSTVDYLTSEARSFVREATHDWLLTPPANVPALLNDLRRRLQAVCAC